MDPNPDAWWPLPEDVDWEGMMNVGDAKFELVRGKEGERD
jgi:hypothetical protein